MLLGEISQTPRKDSMGMDIVPVYEGEEETSATRWSIHPTVQKMGVRTADRDEGAGCDVSSGLSARLITMKRRWRM